MTTLKPGKGRRVTGPPTGRHTWVQQAQDQQLRAKRATSVVVLRRTLKNRVQSEPRHNAQGSNQTIHYVRNTLNQTTPAGEKQHAFRTGVIVGAIGSLLAAALLLGALGYHLIR